MAKDEEIHSFFKKLSGGIIYCHEKNMFHSRDSPRLLVCDTGLYLEENYIGFITVAICGGCISKYPRLVASMALEQSYDCIGQVPMTENSVYTQPQPNGKKKHVHDMMTSSNRNIFRVTGHLCEEFTGHRWIPRTKASDAELWCFLRFTPE